MTRADAIALIEALDTYLDARADRVNHVERRYDLKIVKGYEDDAREVLVEALVSKGAAA